MLSKYLLMEEAKDGTEGAASGGTVAADIKTDETSKTVDTTKTATVITDKAKTDEAKTEVKPDWPDDWRTRISADEKQQKTLQRFASPKALYDSYMAERARWDSKEIQTKLPENPKPEELAQWRKDNGIPASPDKYDLKFEDGLVIGKEDKPAIDAFLKTAHDANMQPAQVKQAISWYYKEQERLAEVQAKADEEQRIEALDKLNAEWGPNFRTEMNMITGSVLSMFPEKVRADLISARMPDGRAVFNTPEVLRAFSALAHIINPAGVVVPAGSGDMAKTVADEIKAIESKMGTKAYIRDEKLQERYRELVRARDSMQAA